MDGSYVPNERDGSTLLQSLTDLMDYNIVETPKYDVDQEIDHDP